MKSSDEAYFEFIGGYKRSKFDFRVPKLVQNVTKGVEYGVCNYYCMFGEHTLPVTVAVEKLSCAVSSRNMLLDSN